MGYLYLVSVKTFGVMYDNTVLIGMVSRGREGAMEGKREGAGFGLFIDTWLHKGHSVSCMTILFLEGRG